LTHGNKQSKCAEQARQQVIKMSNLQFIVSGDTFKVSPCGEWISLWTGECWHVNPAKAWKDNVQTAAQTVLESYKP